MGHFMRIPNSRAINSARKTSKKARTGSAGAVFSLDDASNTTQASPTAQIVSASPVSDISSLLAIQGAESEQQRSAGILHGFNTLDALDALKVDVLSGQVSRQKLLHIASLVEKERANVGDPALMNVLDHIELRARVELAKFEQRQN